MANVKYISAKELAEICDCDNNVVICDIREPNEYQQEHIEGALNVPLSSFETTLPEIKDTNKYVFHCLGGKRTLNNEDKFKNLNCNEVYILNGGINEWKEYNK